MTVEDVTARVKKIRAIAEDHETAHADEDALWYDVLTAIANGAPDAAAIAKTALKTSRINIRRRYG